MSENLPLFDLRPQQKALKERAPLAEKLRPSTIENFIGLDALDSGLVKIIKQGLALPSIILWGPPGSGKTTLAKLIGRSGDYKFVEFSAVLAGVKEVRQIVEEAKHTAKPTVLFVDEIHRFNRAQQDAFLPHVEDGTIVLIGATTENPSFYLNAALISRMKVVVLKPLNEANLSELIKRGEKELSIKINEKAKQVLVKQAAGDGRRLLNILQQLKTVDGEIGVEKLLGALSYDRSGEDHYNMISAFIKSLRGSSVDGALFWGFRMIESGEDPLFIIRRMIIFASEDIGNADPQSLVVANATWSAFEKIGLPEGKIPIAQCITYLASAPKSNKSYVAMKDAIVAVHDNPKVTVPMHLRNAPTKLMQEIGYGEGYKYPHDYDTQSLKDVEYLPEELKGVRFYK